MAHKRDPQFPDMTDITTLQYLRILQDGRRLTRKAVADSKQMNPGHEKVKPPPPPLKRKMAKSKQAGGTKKAKLDEELIPPSPGESDEEIELNYLTACAWGPVLLNRQIWVRRDADLKSGVITELQSRGEVEYVPALYRVSGIEETPVWVDLRKEEALLGSEVVILKEDLKLYQVVSPPGGPVDPDDLHLICLEDKSPHRASSHALKPCSGSEGPEVSETAAHFRNWLMSNSNIVITLENIDQFVLRFVSITTKKETRVGLLLRHNPATGKVFLYVGTKFKWERIEHCEISGNFTEPQAPVRMLSAFHYNSDLIRTYRNFFKKEAPDLEPEAKDEAVFRGEVRCVTCKYILDKLDYRECGRCHECYHVQCLEDTLSVIPLRGTWRCVNCPRCENCFSELGKMLRCTSCNSSFHDRCVDLLLAPAPSKIWKCENCAVCQFCHVRASQHSVKWNDDITMCHPCETKWKKKEFCPVCNVFWYFEGDRLSEHLDPIVLLESQNMICCDRCQLWVHMKCDTRVTPEEWEQYRVINNTKKYFCPQCAQEKRNEDMGKLVRDLMALDSQEFFHHYVDDVHYNKVIKQQMCFDQMLEQAKNGGYSQNPGLFKDHFKLICDNAMCYYKTNANGYVTAQKLLKDGMEVLQKRLALPSLKRKLSEPRPVKKPKRTHSFLEKQLLAFSIPLPLSLTKPESYDFDSDRIVGLPVINFQPPNDFFKIVIMKKDIQPYLKTRDKPAFYLMAMSITYTDFSLNYVELCYLCSSFIVQNCAWVCLVCGRAFHEFCIDQERTQTRDAWKCRECRVCEICKGTSDFSTLIYCSACGKAYDMSCLWPHLTDFSPVSDWKCDSCFLCERCGTKNFRDLNYPAELVTIRKDQDFSKCFQCAWVLDNKQYCPVCEEDWSSPYTQTDVPKDRCFCRHCGFYFHRSCVEGPWKGGCASCLGKNMDYAEAEQTTVQQVQTLMELVSQINFYKSLCKDAVERHYDLPPDFAKMLSNFFLVENSEFMSCSREIKSLFQYRGVDIVKKQCSKEPNYKITTVPKFEGLRRSDVPAATVPEIRCHSLCDSMPVWSTSWDTSTVISRLPKLFSPLDTFSVVKERDMFVSQEQGLYSACRAVVWDFGEFLPVELPCDFEQVLNSPCYWWAREAEVRVPGTSAMQVDDELIGVPNNKITDGHVDVLTSDIDPLSLATQYVNQEVPTALALSYRFEKWLRSSLLKLTLHELNRSRQDRPLTSPIYFPKFPEHVASTEVHVTPVPRPPPSQTIDDSVPGDGSTSLTCVFCKREGELKVSGRLLPSEEGLWAHVNCGYWSVDIEWLQECGGLLNFPQALTRSKKSKCSECGKLGATLICSSKKCHNHYHFPCALSASVRFFEPKILICRDCPLPKDLLTRNPMDTDALARLTHRKWIFTTGKRYARKPPFVRHEFNRIGSLVLCEVPEEGVHEQLESLRLTWVDGQRTLLKCTKNDTFFRVTNVSTNTQLCTSEVIEDLWPTLKLGDSFHLRCAADFFGYSCISNYLPPYPETAYFRNIKEKKPRTLQEILDSLHSPQPGASILLPYDKHRFHLSPQVRTSNTKSTHLEDTEVVHKKDDNALAQEYRKYKKTPNRDEHVEVIRSTIHGLGLFTNIE